MQIAGVGQGIFNEITATVSERRYGGNVIVSTDTRAVGRNRITARLRVLDSRGRGARTAASGRHGPTPAGTLTETSCAHCSARTRKQR